MAQYKKNHPKVDQIAIKMKTVEGKTYRQWQNRNTSHFNALSRIQQKKVRDQGYCNVGWDKVQSSWKLLCKCNKNIASLFEYKLQKGDIIGAIRLSLLEAEEATKIAQEAVNSIDAEQETLTKIANEALAKYPIL